MTPNRSPFIITPLPPIGALQALRTGLDTAVTSILQADGQQLAQAVHNRLIDRLTEATLLAKGLDFGSAAALDQSTLAAAHAEITDAERTKLQSKLLAQRLTRAARTIATRIRRAPLRPIQEHRGGAGRPVDVWKGALLDDVERALREAGVHRCYWSTEDGVATILPDVFRTCAVAAGHPIPGDLRNIQRRRFRPETVLPFSASRLSIRTFAKAIWRFLPLKP